MTGSENAISSPALHLFFYAGLCSGILHQERGVVRTEVKMLNDHATVGNCASGEGCGGLALQLIHMKQFAFGKTHYL